MNPDWQYFSADWGRLRGLTVSHFPIRSLIAMPGPLISEVLPDLLEEMVHLLQGTGAEPLAEQLRGLRIESVCDCGDENCASFATAAEVKVDSVVELEALEGYLIIDLNPANQICFIEVLGRQDVRYLLDEYYESLK